MKILELIANILSFYTMLVMVNIVLKWVARNRNGGGISLINTITEPYFNFFRKFRFSRIGYCDIAPLLGIMVLSGTNQVLSLILILPKITFWSVLSVIIASFWNVFQSVLFFVLCFAAVRYLFMMFSTNKYRPNSFCNISDAFFIPLTARFGAFFFKNSPSGYPRNLIVFIIVLTVFLTAGNFGIKFLNQFLLSL